MILDLTGVIMGRGGMMRGLGGGGVLIRWRKIIIYISKLMVLSACNTARGKIQQGIGIRSLSSTFSYLGCPSIVANLWSASDKASKEIMVEFFKGIKDGLPKDIAMQKAKLKYLEDDDMSSPSNRLPSFWASFIVIGDSGSLNF